MAFGNLTHNFGSLSAPPQSGPGFRPSLGGADMPNGGGIAALLGQQGHAPGPLNSVTLSPQALMTLNPTFEQAQNALTDSITNPSPRHDVQLTPRHEVVVLDEFLGGSPTRPAHGFAVADIVRQVGDLSHDQIALVTDNIPNLAVPSPQRLLTAPGDASPTERLDAVIETTIAGGMSQTNSALEAIAGQQAPNLRGVNYSTSGSSLNGFMYLNQMAIQPNADGQRELTPEGRVIFEALGLPQEISPATLRQFAERGVARFEEVRDQSPLVQGQIQRHEAVSRQLQEMGVHYTVSSGNDGTVVEDYRSSGITVPETSDRNIYANPHNITVGALDTRGTADVRDDQVAAFSVRDPEVDFLADGVDRRVNVFGQEHTMSGTSYAAPDINARLVTLSRQNPGLPASAIQNMLHNSAGPELAGSSVSAIR